MVSDDVRAQVHWHIAEGRLGANVVESRAHGARWLDGLPWTAERLCREWAFHPDGVHPASSRSLVLTGATYGRRAALKIEPVGSGQTEALRVFHAVGHGPEVLAVDVDESASLTEWLPGAAMRFEPAAIGAVASALVTVNAHPGPVNGVATFADALAERMAAARTRLARVPAERSPFNDHLFDLDLERAASITATGLLHGDLVPANALVDDAHGVRFIDAEPYLGPAENDVAHLALRCGGPTDEVGTYLRAALRAVPSLDVDLLRWLVSVHARFFMAYLAVWGRDAESPGARALAVVAQGDALDL